MSAENTKHAQELVVKGQTYRLVIPWQRVATEGPELRSVGPFYDSVPPHPDKQYMPDISYVEGITGQPTKMNEIYRA